MAQSGMLTVSVECKLKKCKAYFRKVKFHFLPGGLLLDRDLHFQSAGLICSAQHHCGGCALVLMTSLRMRVSESARTGVPGGRGTPVSCYKVRIFSLLWAVQVCVLLLVTVAWYSTSRRNVTIYLLLGEVASDFFPVLCVMLQWICLCI